MFVTDAGEPLRAQVSSGEAVHYDEPLIDAADGIRCSALAQTSLTQVSLFLSPATASQTSTIAPSQSPKNLSSPKSVSQPTWKK